MRFSFCFCRSAFPKKRSGHPKLLTHKKLGDLGDLAVQNIIKTICNFEVLARSGCFDAIPFKTSVAERYVSIRYCLQINWSIFILSFTPRNWISSNSGDAAMMYMVLVAGLNFVVLRDAVNAFSPLAFNALRFALASMLIVLPLLLWRLPNFRISRADLLRFVLITALALSYMQFALIGSLTLTTAANSALMLATGPAWTVIIAVLVGRISLNRHLIGGLLVMLIGTSMVILSGEGGLQLSLNDVLGSLLMLSGAATAAAYALAIQPIIERNQSFELGLVKHTTLSMSMVLLALPELIHIQPADIPPSLLPQIAFAGLVATVSGTLSTTFAQSKIGATRMKTYDNVIPVSTAVFAFVLLGEPLVLLQIVGGALALSGVMIVRRFSRGTPKPRAATPQVISGVPAKQT